MKKIIFLFFLFINNACALNLEQAINITVGREQAKKMAQGILQEQNQEIILEKSNILWQLYQDAKKTGAFTFDGNITFLGSPSINIFEQQAISLLDKKCEVFISTINTRNDLINKYWKNDFSTKISFLHELSHCQMPLFKFNTKNSIVAISALNYTDSLLSDIVNENFADIYALLVFKIIYPDDFKIALEQLIVSRFSDNIFFDFYNHKTTKDPHITSYGLLHLKKLYLEKKLDTINLSHIPQLAFDLAILGTITAKNEIPFIKNEWDDNINILKISNNISKNAISRILAFEKDKNIRYGLLAFHFHTDQNNLIDKIVINDEAYLINNKNDLDLLLKKEAYYTKIIQKNIKSLKLNTNTSSILDLKKLIPDAKLINDVLNVSNIHHNLKKQKTLIHFDLTLEDVLKTLNQNRKAF